MNRKLLDPATRLTARAMFYFAHDWHLGHVVPADAATLTARFLYAYSPRLAHRLARKHSPLFRQCISAIENLTVPGILLYYAVRKLAVEDLVRRGINDGVAQVVVLAAGFDTLAVRLHRQFPAVRFIEVDSAEIQALKRRALTGQWAPANNLSFVTADPQYAALEPKLLDSNYVSGVPTLFIVEGLLAFMDDAERNALFDFIKVLGGPGSRALFTVMERGSDGGIHFHQATWLARLWWRVRGERVRWGPGRGEIEEYLESRGFELRSILSATEFRLRYLDGNLDLPLAGGEDVVLAQVGSRKTA